MSAEAQQALVERIADEIRRDGPLSFARFMERALYDPEAGYYARGADRLGVDGDFFTASDSGRAFGRCIARQLADVDRAFGLLEPFEPFQVVELGGGRGLLARDILDGLPPDLASRLRYTLVDRSPAMRGRAAATVPEARVVAPEALPARISGAVVACELFDALPVHRVRRRGDRLVEVAVGLGSDGALAELERDPAPEILALAERYGAASRDGSEAEVCPAALELVDDIAARLERGVVLVVDYGDRAEPLYGPGRERGTLLAYRRHATGEAYLDHVGEQDLTAHVNFSALMDRASERGLDVLGLTTQDRFLIGCGILEVFEDTDPASWNEPRRVKERLQAKQLIHPTGMGRAFRVLILSRGVDPPPRLIGLADPFARES